MNQMADDKNVDKEEYFENLRNMTGEQRLELAFELSNKARQELIADIKRQHPDFTQRQVMNEVLRRCYGEELFREIAAAKGWEE